MATMSPHDVTGLAAEHFERWRRPHDDAGSSDRHASVNDILRIAATITLGEIDIALARMDEGRYGLCVTCSQPLPDARLDVLPKAPLCISCHYNNQNCHSAGETT